MRALVLRKSIPRYVWTRLLAARSSRLATAPGTLLGLENVPEPKLPGTNWVRVRPLLSGICGSDLSVIRSQGSLYLSALTSFPFVPGHEIYGEVIETGTHESDIAVGDRVAVEPTLGCIVRGFPDLCSACSRGRYANCLRVTEGDITEGLQTGFCRSTGGGWSSQLVAHQSQVYRIPEDMSPEAAVLVEPFSCAVHSVLQSEIGQNQQALVIGCGSIGLLTIKALRKLVSDCRIVAVAKYIHQRKLAKEMGADQVVPAGAKGYEKLSEITDATLRPLELGKPVVIGGFSHVFECVGSPSALDDATRWASENGIVVMQGMPSSAGADLVPVWYKQLHLIGAYTYGLEKYHGKEIKTFQLALDLLNKDGLAETLAGLVRHKFPLSHYRDAIDCAIRAGKMGGVKTVFDLTDQAA